MSKRALQPSKSNWPTVSTGWKPRLAPKTEARSQIPCTPCYKQTNLFGYMHRNCEHWREEGKTDTGSNDRLALRNPGASGQLGWTRRGGAGGTSETV